MGGVTWGEGLALAIGAKVNPYCVPHSLALVCSLQGRPPVIDRPVVLVNPRSKNIFQRDFMGAIYIYRERERYNEREREQERETERETERQAETDRQYLYIYI